MKPASAKSCPACGERYEGDVLFCPKDGTPLASARSTSFQGVDGDAYVGVELAGQIRIKHLIGIGSMGRVYRAFQAGIERDVAVKILHRELSGNSELVARFHREAKVASRLVHPNVVQVLMTGTVPFRSDPRVGGEMYLVMEHLDGISLLSALAAAGNTGDKAALPLPRALHIVLQLCDAVGEAHAQGIVHRDLKPENVMLIRRGEDPDYVKVLDFGIARIDWANQSMATQAGLIFGTAKYISPEGAAGEGVGPPADVYSIATILYQCLAGRAPFEDESPVALLVQHTHAVPPELRSIPRASYVPAPIAEVVMQNLSKKPSARSQDARAFGRELVAAMRASGLDPEEIIAHSTLLVRGALRLASYARTKNMDMTPELAKVIAEASKAPPLPAPPPPPGGGAPPVVSASPAPTLVDATADDLAQAGAASAAKKEEPAPTPAVPSGAEAILVGVRPTDTMVVLASELIDVVPPPLPAPPPGEPAALVGAAEARSSSPGEPPPAEEIPARESAVPPDVRVSQPPDVRLSQPGEARPSQPGDVRPSQPLEALPPPLPVSASRSGEEAPAPAIEAPAAPAAAPPAEAAPAPQAVQEAPPPPAAEQSAATSATATPAPAVAESASGGAAAPKPPELPPPALRTLFDAPAPEAVSAPPPLVASAPEAVSAPPPLVAPERPGGTIVGDVLDGDSIDTSIPPRASAPGAPAAAAPPRTPSRAPELDWNDEASKPAVVLHSSPGAAHGSPAPRSRVPRVLAILAIAAAAAGGAIGLGHYLNQAETAQSADEADELLEQARECARTRSWDSPPGANFKDITARALDRSPNDPAVLDLRRDAAEKIVTEALGKKYAGQQEDALRLAKLALELHPALTTAQLLVAELEAARDAAAASASASAAPSGSAAEASTAEPAVSSAKPVASGKPTGKAVAPPPSALPSAKGSGSSVAPGKSGKPAAPPPGSGTAAVLPPPTGPWL